METSYWYSVEHFFALTPHLHTEGALDQMHWPDKYPACGGQKQSPIDIQRRNVRFNPEMLQLELSGYDAQRGTFLMSNNGHTGETANKWRNMSELSDLGAAPLFSLPMMSCAAGKVAKSPPSTFASCCLTELAHSPTAAIAQTCWWLKSRKLLKQKRHLPVSCIVLKWYVSVLCLQLKSTCLPPWWSQGVSRADTQPFRCTCTGEAGTWRPVEQSTQ